mmetsp:Transcript_52169/g.53149  ORF Transcript_52169/g.53149 Transcript_52169/m.53149 type:complete len:189 (-) Transcript_52169:3-569(-)
MSVAAVLTGSTVAASEGLQTNRLRGNSQRRVLVDGTNFCPPKYVPNSGTTCSLTGMYVGTCYYSSSAKNDAEPTNTDSQACSCNENKSGKFACKSQPFPGGAPTNPPVPVPSPSPTPDPVWCPTDIPKTNDACKLPLGKTSGSCSFYSTTSNGMTTDNCSCNGTTFTCISSMTPITDPKAATSMPSKD